MADGVWKGVQPKVIGHFKQLSQNKFFDTSTPSMRKGRNGGEKKKVKKTSTKSVQNCESSEKLNNFETIPIDYDKVKTELFEHCFVVGVYCF